MAPPNAFTQAEIQRFKNENISRASINIYMQLDAGVSIFDDEPKYTL